MKDKPNFGYIQVTRTCNQKCVFCSNPYVEDTLTLEDGKKQIDYYVDECGVNEIILSGGEPTLNTHLPDFIEYSFEKGATPRIITNGQKISEINYFKKLYDKGLRLFMVSIYSHDKKIHDKLTGVSGSYDKLMKALKNVSDYVGFLNINITINSLNVKSLHETVFFLIQKFPKIKHFVFNNLDPTGRAVDNLWTVPKLVDIELPLAYTVKVLKQYNKSFRIERVPLCYMDGFEEFSTETRRIVKNQAYRCLFLEESGRRLFEKKNSFYYPNGKIETCQICTLNEICTGLNTRYVKLLDKKELYPVFKDPNKIIKKIQ
ncbi:radical SAM protein [archaeon]|jgi:MoaA/NifB/PqqE/SkfB family radical SAM enzyme|nr:radical SAM protein [Candidatus Woesearchaeota archaeon]MBT3464263.1 radical SAM protein [archaeon]MBT4352871.1 radical SAM protein [archaeon]MBT4647486.1 radical SAM protein [archaeon]MBT6822017.1 radical SAM protein [archaeon]